MSRRVPRRRALAGTTVLALTVAACSAGDDATATTTTTAAVGAVDLAPLPDRTSPLTAEELGSLRFVDVTEEAGLDAPHSDVDLRDLGLMTAGAAAADVDDDGDDDLYVTRVGLPNLLYLNQGDGTFVDVAAQVGVDGATPEEGSSAAAFADIDGDGDQDLFVTSAGRSDNVLFVNNGRGGFVDETAARGLSLGTLPASGGGAQMHGAAFADVNGDGALDLLTTHWRGDLLKSADTTGIDIGDVDPRVDGAVAQCRLARGLDEAGWPTDSPVTAPRARLYLNSGAGTFEDATEAFGLDLEHQLGFAPVFADVDDDGRPDLFVTGDGCTSRLFMNRDGLEFDDVTQEAGVGTDQNGMGSVVTDLDGDGDLDWFVTAIGYPTASGACPLPLGITGCSGNRYYRNDGLSADGDHPVFVDATDDLGLRNGWWGWGAAIEDFDHDGTPEVVMTNGQPAPSHLLGAGDSDPSATFYATFDGDPMRFWVGSAGEGFSDAASLVGLTDTGAGRALIPFDYDLDGDLDLFVANESTAPRLYRNESTSDNAWLAVRLDDRATTGNRRGEGADVTVIRADGLRVSDRISTNGSYEAQVPPEARFGLGPDVDRVDLEVRWPDGERQVVPGVATRRRMVVIRET